MKKYILVQVLIGLLLVAVSFAKPFPAPQGLQVLDGYATIESINTAAELESVANLGGYASDILAATDEADFKSIVNLEANIDYEPALTDEASLYSTLSDVTQFYEAGDEDTIAGLISAGAYNDDSVQADDIDLTDFTSSDLTFDADSVALTSVYSGTTSLEEATGSTDCGAYLIGVYAAGLTNSDAENIYDVLVDFDDLLNPGSGDSNIYVDNENGNPNISDTIFDVAVGVTQSTWESVGPTDAGTPDNEWAVLDDVPSDADWIEVKLYLYGSEVAGTAGTSEYAHVHVRENGSSQDTGIDNRIGYIRSLVTSGDDASSTNITSHKIPLGTDKIFDIIWTSTYSEYTYIQLVLVGYGYDDVGGGGGGGTDDQTATEVSFTPYDTLASTNTQAAIQELLDESTGTDDQNAGEVAFTPYSTLASTDVQAAIQELLDESTGTDDQNAGEVVFTPYDTLAATDVQAAIQELLDESTGTDDQNAGEVAFTPYSTIAATDVQAAIQEVLDESAGGGDVVGPATHSADYVPQWNGVADSKTLVQGFDISAAGKDLVGYSTTSAMRSHLGLTIGTHVQAHDDYLDDISAISPSTYDFIYYNGSDFVGGDLTNYIGNYGGDANTGKIFLNDTTPSTTNMWRAHDGAATYLFSMAGGEGTKYEGVESSTTPGNVLMYLEHDIVGDSATHFEITPGCIYVETKTTNTDNKHNAGITIMAIAENASVKATVPSPSSEGNYDDAVAVAGRTIKSNSSYGDACGIWGSAYNDYNSTKGGVMGLEGSIYQNSAGMLAGDTRGDKWSTALHAHGASTGSNAKAGIIIDNIPLTSGYGFWNGILMDQNLWWNAGAYAQGLTGTVGINMGSFDISYGWPQYGIKFGYAGETTDETKAHIYCGNANLKIASRYEQIYYIDGDNNGLDHFYWVSGTTPTGLMQLDSVTGNLWALGNITAGGSCCDYVLEPGYELMPLDDLSSYIKEHTRLPGIVTESGVSMTELYEKIEEQSLYILQLHERLKKLEVL